jgi:hypothetical protein
MSPRHTRPAQEALGPPEKEDPMKLSYPTSKRTFGRILKFLKMFLRLALLILELLKKLKDL